MTAGAPTFAQLRARARQARGEGQYAAAAHLEGQAAERAEALGWWGERARALLWRGYSLRQAGEGDLALATLLQAVNERSAAIDAADGFAALIAIIHLSLDRKPVAFCRGLLEQARRSVAEIRQPWTAPLDYLEGELAYRRGEFAVAWDWRQRAWASWRDAHPRLTAATHLWALARAAFRQRDGATLARWTDALVELDPPLAVERQLAQRAQLLNARARRVIHPDEAPPVALARRLLAAVAASDQDFGARGEALRVLALAGCWEEVEATRSAPPLEPDRFESALLWGDLALQRARSALGLPAVDDDYGQDAGAWPTECGSPWRETASRHYRAALPLAERADARLETAWHCQVVQERLARL